ncbi:MAG TPA: aminotransferase class V-fold PLP-dependent enzyme [Bryobacteraceae bacterium]|nr:aminotransferase class V-fold PLP-dependent enzyme [Bryobacteraceae bacterium]
MKTPNPLAQQLGIREVINGRSFSTKCGGSILDEKVIAAMQQAAKVYFRIEDLQEAASRVIARITGAEAGYVTSGASAALTLAAAACMTGLDPAKMNRLPDTAGMKNEVVIQRGHRNDYDHALRAAGARLKEVGFAYATFPYELEEGIDPNTAAVFYLTGIRDGSLPLPEVTRIAHRKNVPVIVDASPQLPPRENLRTFLEQGADLVAFSGGKHIRGPQASGFLCGRRDLIMAVALQHQDMDVFPETWTYRGLIKEKCLPGPPHHGIGRGYKAGKEEIVGLITALNRYMERDLDAELGQWRETVRILIEGAGRISGLRAREFIPAAGAKPVPAAHIEVDPAVYGIDAHAVINALQEGDPIITVFEAHASEGLIVILPEALRPGEAQLIVERLAEIRSAGR